jgi:F0F1-type ATP synthase membrane subunit a
MSFTTWVEYAVSHWIILCNLQGMCLYLLTKDNMRTAATNMPYFPFFMAKLIFKENFINVKSYSIDYGEYLPNHR